MSARASGGWKGRDPLQLLIRLDSALPRSLRPTMLALWNGAYRATLVALMPFGAIFAVMRRSPRPNSVIHICYMNHVPYHWVEILRRHGIDAAYLAIGRSPLWDKSDYRHEQSVVPFVTAWREFILLWTVVARYEVAHFHFMQPYTRTGWEFAVLKRLGRRIVVYWAGCELRDRGRNMALHPDCNICQDCDYNASICTSPKVHKRREAARRWGDVTLVSTPDMKDFAPDAVHFPFFLPDVAPPPAPGRRWPERDRIKIVHATGHPGIEGSAAIAAAMETLKAKGWPIDYHFLRNVPHDRIMEALRDADIAIGKMKMGYYANFQIEAMSMGVPTVTWVRPEFMTDELRQSGFIFSSLSRLAETLEHYLRHPEQLVEKRRVARSSILDLHGDLKLVKQLMRLYGWEAAATRLHDATAQQQA